MNDRFTEYVLFDIQIRYFSCVNHIIDSYNYNLKPSYSFFTIFHDTSHISNDTVCKNPRLIIKLFPNPSIFLNNRRCRSVFSAALFADFHFPRSAHIPRMILHCFTFSVPPSTFSSPARTYLLHFFLLFLLFLRERHSTMWELRNSGGALSKLFFQSICPHRSENFCRNI